MHSQRKIRLPYILIIFFFISLLISCEKYNTYDLRDATKDGVYAIAVLNDTIKIPNLFDSENGNTSYHTDEQGRITIKYSGKVVKEDVDIVAPPIIGFGNFEILDTLYIFDYGFGSVNTIDSAVIKEDKIQFQYVSIINKPLKVRVWIDEITKDGKPISEEIMIPAANGEKLEIMGASISMADYNLKGNDNKLTVHYQAIDDEGKQHKLTNLYFSFNKLKFKYVQGYFPKTERQVEGNFIPIGLYKFWTSGSMFFKDPKILISVENAFGFPVGSRFNKMEIKTIDGKKVELESQQLQEGIVFDYPKLDEVGQKKYSAFYFDKQNSNIPILFEELVEEVYYDVTALANPDDIPNFIGFATDSSYYIVQLKVEVPLEMSLNQLEILDTIDVNISNPTNKYFDSLEVKSIFENLFPFEIDAQVYMIDETGMILDSLFQEKRLFLPGADVDDAGNLLKTSREVNNLIYTEAQIENVLKTKHFVLKARMHSLSKYPEPIWIYDHYGLSIKVGTKFSIK